MTEKIEAPTKILGLEEREIVRIFYNDLIKIRIGATIYEEAVFLMEVIARAKEKYLKEPEHSADLFLKIIDKTAQELIEKPSKTKMYRIKQGVAHVLLGTAKELFNKYKEIKEIKKLIGVDTLTNLPGIKILKDDLEMAIDNEKKKRASANERREGETPFSFVMIDIDYFKKVNDTHGHPAGDQILQYLAADLKRIIRSQDKAYRYGGEEFSLLIEETEENVRALLKRLLHNFQNKKFEIKDHDNQTHQVGITISIGSVSSDRIDNAELTFDNFKKKADKAMYRIKKNGRNQIFQVGVDQETE